jgi:hypothetical protein
VRASTMNTWARRTNPKSEPRCKLCGRPITEPEFVDVGLCGDCYWDDQTNADGTLGDE